MRWPHWNPQPYFIDPFDFFGASISSRSGNVAGYELFMPSPSTVGGGWFDARIFWIYNPVAGFTVPLTGKSPHHKQTSIPAYFTSTSKSEGHEIGRAHV